MRIVLADSNEAARATIELALENYPAFNLIGEVQDGESLLEFTEKQSADLILLDGNLPGIPMQALIGMLHALNPGLIVVAMSSKLEKSRSLLRAGANCFVTQGDSPYWLLEQLQKYAN